MTLSKSCLFWFILSFLTFRCHYTAILFLLQFRHTMFQWESNFLASQCSMVVVLAHLASDVLNPASVHQANASRQAECGHLWYHQVLASVAAPGVTFFLTSGLMRVKSTSSLVELETGPDSFTDLSEKDLELKNKCKVHRHISGPRTWPINKNNQENDASDKTSKTWNAAILVRF